MSDPTLTHHSPLFVEHALDLRLALERARRAQARADALRALFEASEGDDVLHTDMGRALGRAAGAWRVALRPRAALDASEQAQQVWQQRGRPKASFLLRLGHVQLWLQLGLLPRALELAHALRHEHAACAALAPYEAFVHEALGCAQGALGQRLEARASFEAMRAHRTTRRARIRRAQRLLALCM